MTDKREQYADFMEYMMERNLRHEQCGPCLIKDKFGHCTCWCSLVTKAFDTWADNAEALITHGSLL